MCFLSTTFPNAPAHPPPPPILFDQSLNIIIIIMSLDMMNDIGIDKKQQLNIIKKMMNIAIRATYYIFCYRNRTWDSPT